MQPDDLLAREGYAPKDVPALLAWARARANVLLQGLDPDSTLGELLGGTSGHVSRDSSFVARRDSFEFPEERDEFDELEGDIPADLRQAVTAATSSQPPPAPVIDDDPDSGLGGFARFQSMLKLSRPYPVRQPEPVVEEPRPTLMRSFALAAQRESDYPSSTPSPPADLSATLPLAAALGISSEESAALVLGIPDEDGSEGSGLNDFFNPNANPDLLGSRLSLSSTTVSSRTSSHASGFIDDDDDVRMPIQDDDDVRMPIQDDDDDLPLPTLQDDELPGHGEAAPMLDDVSPFGSGLPAARLDDHAPVRRASLDDMRRTEDHAPVRRTSLDDVRSVLVDDDESPLRRAVDDVRRGDDRPLRGPSIEDVRRLIAPTRRPSLDDVRSALMDDDEAPPSRGSAPVRRSSLDDVRSVLLDDDEAPPVRGSAPVRRSSVDDVRSVLVDDDEAPPVRGSAPVRRSSVDDVRSALVDDDDAPPVRGSAPVRRPSVDDVRSALVDDDDDAPPTRSSAPARHESLDDVRGVLVDDDDAPGLSDDVDDDDDDTSAEPVRTRDTPPMPGLPAIDVDADSGAPVLRHRTPKKKVVELGAPVGKPRAGTGTGAVGPRGPTPKPPPPRKPPPPPARKPPPPPTPVDDDIQELSRVELIEDLPSYLRDDDE